MALPIPLPDAGHKQSGFFSFDDPLLGKYRWPYVAVVGAEPGLRFLLTAGIHAAEYTGILAAIRIGRRLDPADVRGTIVILPLLNVPGFYARSVYVNPEDNQNLNRAFPGKPDGTWSERFAHHVLHDVVLHFDRDMDLHAGDMIEDLEPFVGLRETGNAEVDAASRQMLNAYGGVRWATLSVPSRGRSGMLYATAAEHGIPAILAESGRCGLPEEEAIRRHEAGVLNIWRTLGLLTDEPPRAVEPPRLLTRSEWLRAEHEGIFLCRVRPGQPVEAGQVVGEMIDLLGNHLTDVIAPLTGVVLFTVTSPAVQQGGLLLSVASGEDDRLVAVE
jgi:predicted deacylase